MSDDKNISKEEQHHDISGKSRNERVSLGLTMAIYALIGVFALYLVGDLYKTTVIDYDIYARAASDQQWRMMSYAADRGVIYDANNMPVASNTYNYTVVISPKVLMSSDEIEEGTLSRDQLINDMATLFEMDASEIDEVLPYDPEDATACFQKALDSNEPSLVVDAQTRQKRAEKNEADADGSPRGFLLQPEGQPALPHKLPQGADQPAREESPQGVLPQGRRGGEGADISPVFLICHRDHKNTSRCSICIREASYSAGKSSLIRQI